MFKIGAPSGAITYKRRLDRTTDELVGLCRGLLADGAVCQSEAEYLQRWLHANRQFVHEYPFRDIYAVVESALVDGVMDAEEERDILSVVHQLAGSTVPAASVEMRDVSSSSSQLPLCVPPPLVDFSARAFVVTGVFQYGPRSRVISAIAERGGEVKKNLSQQVHYLVVGDVGSRDWLHSSFGTKIKGAVEMRDAGSPIRIVGESHWAQHLGG